MTVHFINDGRIDLNTIRLMGVSVKETSNPIGFFGTGMKIAIAVLLRTGHKVELVLGDKESYVFSARPERIRDQLFHVVHMNEEKLGFTTELGKQWEVWQAYRELHSNALDENGFVTTTKMHGDTRISVTGTEIHIAFNSRHEIFLSTPAIDKISDRLAIHPGSSRFIYYRGVRVGAFPEGRSTIFTYNILAPMKLTEDRTLASFWDMEYHLASTIPQTKSPEVADQLLAGTESYDQKLNFTYCSSPSEVFLDRAQASFSDHNASEFARTLVASKRQQLIAYPAVSISPEESEMMQNALNFLSYVLDCKIDPECITVTDTLGAGVYGLFHRASGKIYLARQTFDNGFNFLAATLYEEWLHKHHHLEDKSRAMQQFLFDRLIAIAIRNY